MFSTVNHSQVFKPGSVNLTALCSTVVARCGRLEVGEAFLTGVLHGTVSHSAPARPRRISDHYRLHPECVCYTSALTHKTDRFLFNL